MQDKIMNCIVSAVEVLNETLENKIPIEEGRDCPLYSQGVMDSISLVTLISLVEQHVEDTFDQSIILANEKAVSMKNSPFLTVGRLSDYTEQLLQAGESA